LDALTTASHAVSAKLYEAQKAGGGGSSGSGGTPGGGAGGQHTGPEAESSSKDGDDVIDADYKDVN